MESFVEKIYPHLTNSFVAQIATNFNLGKIVAWSGIPGGWANVNIKLETQKDEFVVRFYRYGARSAEDINLEFAVLDKLTSFGLPVAPALVDKDSQRIVTTQLADKKIYYAVFKYLPGEQPLLPNPYQLQALGQALAQIHLSLANFSSKHVRKYWHFKAEISKLKRKIMKRVIARPWQFEDKISLTEFIALVNSETSLFLTTEKKFRKMLRAESIIHGDFHAGNVKFANDKVVGIFDFDSLMHGPTILDLAICCANLKMQNAEQEGHYSIKKILKLVTAGYERKIKLTSKQKQILPKLIRFWLFSQLTWTLKLPVTAGQQFFYQQVFERVIKVLKEKPVV